MARGHAPNIGEKVEQTVAFVKANNPKFSAAIIRRHLLNNLLVYGLKEGQVPGKRSIQQIIKRRANSIRTLQSNPLDQPWNIGVCSKYNISPDAVPALIAQQHRFLQQRWSIRLTIRQAKWLAQVHPVALRLAEKKYPADPELQCDFLYLIAVTYARAEQHSELIGRELDTSDLDNLYFVSDDADTMEGEIIARGLLEELALYREMKEERKHERPHSQKI